MAEGLVRNVDPRFNMVGDADIDLTSATSEADLKATILARLGRYRMAPIES